MAQRISRAKRMVSGGRLESAERPGDGAARALPGLQRGLLGRRRPRRRSHPPHAPVGGADRRRGGLRAARADAAPSCTTRGAHGPRARSCPCRPGPHPMGQPEIAEGVTHCKQPSPATASVVPGPGRHRRAARRRPGPRGNRLAADPRLVRRTARAHRQSGRPPQPVRSQSARPTVRRPDWPPWPCSTPPCPAMPPWRPTSTNATATRSPQRGSTPKRLCRRPTSLKESI